MSAQLGLMALGALMGGSGGSKQQTNVTLSSTNENVVAPSNVISIGGSVSSDPAAQGSAASEAFGSPTMGADSGGGFGYPSYGGDPLGAEPVMSSPAISPMLLIAGGLALVYFMKGGF